MGFSAVIVIATKYNLGSLTRYTNQRRRSDLDKKTQPKSKNNSIELEGKVTKIKISHFNYIFNVYIFWEGHKHMMKTPNVFRIY